MKRLSLLLATLALPLAISAQVDSAALYLAQMQRAMDSVENSLTYEHGTIQLGGGVGSIAVPAGFKYLNAEQAQRVLVDLWGNPSSENMTLGMLMPENNKVLADSGYVFNILYDEIGYVKDDDADDIDYDELLEQMKEETVEGNKEREKNGYEAIAIVGWAAKPFYDKDRKILHWAKEIRFGESEVNTLNYNVRVLGRKGVLVLNAIASMPNYPLVERDISKVLDIVEFSEDLKYEKFDPSIDEVAAWTIGGLVAGKVLAKAGILAVILKFWKVILLAVGGGFATFWKKIFGKKEKENPYASTDSNQTPSTGA